MLFAEETGVLLHPTSLPGEWGVGTLGREAFRFAEWMAGSGLTVWQLLPLSPPVYANSPYQALSSSAGNPLLISPHELFNQGFISSKELASAKSENSSTVSWERLSGRVALLKQAAERAIEEDIPGFQEFYKQKWVKEWAFFAAKKEMNGGLPWTLWRSTNPPDENNSSVHAMIQFLFNQQWMQLKNHCNSLGISILGDIPIYAAHDSADVFFNRKLFKLNADGLPYAVAGVPPDYFSTTGQLWGNPVYDWEACANSEFQWWTERVQATFSLYDTVRIDHFRGFAEYWEIPAGEKTAVNGRWEKGPGIDLFNQMEKSLGKLPLIAEDLGLITPSVHHLRELCGFPGMVVLQFALQNPEFAADKIDPNSVIYTGTHDNDTTAGWIRSTGKQLGYNSVSSLIQMALDSPAELAVIPMQDILQLNSKARMNTPSKKSGNWSWRMTDFPETVSLYRGN